MIKDLHQSSIDWYNNLPDDLDLIVTHVPPIRTRRGSCYFYEVDDYKAPVWIFGHDHTIHADIQDGAITGKVTNNTEEAVTLDPVDEVTSASITVGAGKTVEVPVGTYMNGTDKIKVAKGQEVKITP